MPIPSIGCSSHRRMPSRWCSSPRTSGSPAIRGRSKSWAEGAGSLFVEAGFALVTEGMHDHVVLGGAIFVESDVSRSATRDDELAEISFDPPADKRVRFEDG